MGKSTIWIFFTDGVLVNYQKIIKKTGVFVNEHPEIVISLVEEYALDAIQLHGDESVAYITELKKQLVERRTLFLEENKQIKKKKNRHIISEEPIEIIKVFGIKNEFNFEILQPYLEFVDYFLFDTKGNERGGNGVAFDWSILDQYSFKKPFFLSGGIGLENIKEVQKIMNSNLPIYAVDINSKVEIKPGVKNIEEVKIFKNTL